MTVIIGLFIALLTVLNILSGGGNFVLNWHRHIQTQLEKPEYRLKTADALTSHMLLNFYQDWLEYPLDWLDDPHRMGPLNTYFGALQGFNVCLAVAAAYSALTIIIELLACPSQRNGPVGVGSRSPLTLGSSRSSAGSRQGH